MNPVSLALVGEQSSDLLEYLGNSGDVKDKIKHEITSGNFDFKMNGMIRVPNPKYNPDDDREARAKRARKEGVLSTVSVSTMEKVTVQYHSLT